MSEALKGACLCGGVEYEVRDPQSMGYCHCTRCQRWTGESLAGVVVAADNFEFTKGEELVKTYESEFAPRNFCSNCGSSIYDDLGENYFVAAGLMRELDLEPSFHLLVAYKAAWNEISGDAPQFAENPPGCVKWQYLPGDASQGSARTGFPAGAIGAFAQEAA